MKMLRMSRRMWVVMVVMAAAAAYWLGEPRELLFKAARLSPVVVRTVEIVRCGVPGFGCGSPAFAKESQTVQAAESKDDPPPKVPDDNYQGTLFCRDLVDRHFKEDDPRTIRLMYAVCKSGYLSGWIAAEDYGTARGRWLARHEKQEK